MIKIVSALVFWLSLGLSGLANAEAGLTLNFINKTELAIRYITVSYADEGSSGHFGGTIHVVPGNKCTFSSNGSAVTGISVDMGVERYEFKDCSALKGGSELTLTITRDEDGTPRLTEGDGAGKPDEVIVEAGPIWNGDHARERCPQVLEEWLRAHPDQEATWDGAWWTMVPSEMSVCALKLTGATQDGTPPVSIAGTRTAFVLPEDTDGAAFSGVLEAGTMAELRNLNGTDIAPSDKKKGLTLKIRFADMTWAARVEPNSNDFDILSGYNEEKVRPGRISMFAWASVDDRKKALDAINAMNWRPWFLHLKAGSDMDTQEAFGMPQEFPDAVEAWETLLSGFLAFGTDMADPRSAETLLLSEEGYQMAVNEEQNEFPGFRVKADNSRVLWIDYRFEAKMLADMAR